VRLNFVSVLIVFSLDRQNIPVTKTGRMHEPGGGEINAHCQFTEMDTSGFKKERKKRVRF
jgi:hypothetical protein